MTTEARDPVAALADRMMESWQDNGSTIEEALRSTLAEQGYVLVNEKRLAAAYCRVKHGREHLTCDSYNAAAIFAAIQEQER